MTGPPCPSCGFVNLAGEDRCEHCFHSLMQRDLPQPRKDDRFQQAMMTAPISELITGKDLLVASPSDTLDKIVEIFKNEKKNCILIYKKKTIVGILSNRDLLWKVAGIHPDLTKVKAESVMTRNPEYVRAEDPIAYVVNKMAMGGFRHVPVLSQDGTPITIITIKHILSYLARAGSKNAS